MSIELKPGDRIKDNDPRTANRVLEIIEVRALPGLPTLVKASNGVRSTIISLERIYTDGKRRRSGFSLVTDEAK